MNEQASMDQLFLEKVHEAIENNFSKENFGVDELALEIGISRSQLHRRLKFIKCSSASQMIKEFRLKKAHELLQHKAGTASEISYQVGFSSPSYFNTCFNEYFGYPPGKVKRVRSSGSAKKHSISRKFMFISLASLVVIASAFIIYFTLSDRNIETTEAIIIKKSIAVIPFKSLSDDPEKQFLADGVMDAIILHLSKIKDLRVMDRTSVEQYRETDKTTTIIAQELDVTYLLEGSFQMVGDQFRLIVKLIKPGKEGPIWAEDYNKNWKDIFSVQSEVAQTIARELQAVITPEEIQLIEKIPTVNLTAYDFYQRGMAEMVKFWIGRFFREREALEKAEDNFHKALAYDSTFALAYTGLGHVYWSKHLWKNFLSENFLDSVLILADRALSFDDQLAEAYVLRGSYYRMHYNREQAILEFDKAIKFNPNTWRAYWYKGWVYFSDDLVKTIDNLHKSASVHRGPFLPQLLQIIANAYAIAGFNEKAIYYQKEALKLDGDSASYYSFLADVEHSIGNYEKAIEFGEKSNAIDSTYPWVIFLLGLNHTWLGHAEESLEYMKKYDRGLGTTERPFHYLDNRIGHAYWINGFKKEANYYFEEGLANIR